MTDPEAMTSLSILSFSGEMLTEIETIMEAVKKSGVRALVSAGWGGLGGADVPDEVFILEGMLALEGCPSTRLTDQEISLTIGSSPRAESRQFVTMVEPEPQPLVSGMDSQRSLCLSSVIRSKIASTLLPSPR